MAEYHKYVKEEYKKEDVSEVIVEEKDDAENTLIKKDEFADQKVE
jgi:hypothetical protein